MRRYEQRVVAITGAARGLGQAMAERFASEGARVAIADLDGPGADAAAQALKEANGVKAVGNRVDVSSSTEVHDWLAHLEADLGPVDVLVNNAGIIRDGRVETLTDEEWRSVLDVNLTSAFNGVRAVLPA
jgi:3-oxoacyl-[acyl-carrier protein] reductase